MNVATERPRPPDGYAPDDPMSQGDTPAQNPEST